MGGFEVFFEKFFEFIAFFKFWRVVPYNKRLVRIRWGKNPKVLGPGLHFIWPFEITHTKACMISPDWQSTLSIHLTTKDLKTASFGPMFKYKITDPIAWFYNVTQADNNIHDVVRLCASDILTDCEWKECMTKPVWTKIKNKIKDKTTEFGIEIEEFGLIDFTISRIIITSLNN